MVQQGGLGRGLASLIPQKKKNPATDGTKRADEEQSYFNPNFSQKKSNSTIGRKGIQGKESEAAQVISKTKQEVSGSVDEKIEQTTSISEEKQELLEGILNVSVDDIVSNPHQPRTNFNEDKLAELADSIKEHGVIQPLIVSSVGAGKYELIAGERRLEASKLTGLKNVPVIVKAVDEQKKAEWALVENVQRHDLDPMEEARAYRKMQDKFLMTQEEVAVRVGKSRSSIANSLRLLNLPMEIQRALMEGKISEGHAKIILGITNSEKQRALFVLILKESLNVRQTEQKVKEFTGAIPRRRKTDIDPALYSKQESLAQSLGTKVQIKKSLNGGNIVIDFYSDEELDSLLTSLSAQNG